MKSKLNLSDADVQELTHEEKVNIVGGDKFLRDFGRFLGKLVATFEDQGHDSGSRAMHTALH